MAIGMPQARTYFIIAPGSGGENVPLNKRAPARDCTTITTNDARVPDGENTGKLVGTHNWSMLAFQKVVRGLCSAYGKTSELLYVSVEYVLYSVYIYYTF